MSDECQFCGADVETPGEPYWTPTFLRQQWRDGAYDVSDSLTLFGICEPCGDSRAAFAAATILVRREDPWDGKT